MKVATGTSHEEFDTSANDVSVEDVEAALSAEGGAEDTVLSIANELNQTGTMPLGFDARLEDTPTTSLLLCGPGYFFKDSGNTAQGSCEPCPMGKFKRAAGGASDGCLACTGAYFQSSMGGTNCSACRVCEAFATQRNHKSKSLSRPLIRPIRNRKTKQRS